MFLMLAIFMFLPVLEAAIDKPSSFWQYQFGAQKYVVANDWTVDEGDAFLALTSASECEGQSDTLYISNYELTNICYFICIE